MKTEPTSFETGNSLARLKKVLIVHWEDLVREVITNSQHESSIVLQDHIPEILDQLIEVLRTGKLQKQELGKSHGFQRAALTNFSLEDLLTEYSLLRETLVDYLYPMGDIECAKLVHKYIDILSKNATLQFINESNISLPYRSLPLTNEISEIKENPVINTH